MNNTKYVSPKESAYCPECKRHPQQIRTRNHAERFCSDGHTFTLKESREAEARDNQWQPIETAPKDGRAVLLLSLPYELDAGPNGIHQIPAKVAIGHWYADGTSWVSEGPHKDQEIYLAKTGVWFSGGGWFQPDEVSHWQPLPAPPAPAAEEE